MKDTYPHPRSAEFIEGLAAYRGGQWGLMYAKAFEVVVREYSWRGGERIDIDFCMALD